MEHNMGHDNFLSLAQTLLVIYLRLTCDWTFELLAMTCKRFQHAEYFTLIIQLAMTCKIRRFNMLNI